MDPLDPNRLLAFLAVASHGSFSAAARALSKTQPSVSQAVALLERELGAQLFVRDGRRTRLSDAGKALRPQAEAAVEALSRARHAVTAAGVLGAGHLHVGTSDTLACHLLPPVFAAFRARHPQVELRIVNRPSPAVAALCADGEVDLGVVSLPLPAGLRVGGQPATRRLQITPLCKQDDVLITPPRHRLAGRHRVTLEALQNEPLLLLDPSTATRAFLDEAFMRGGLHPRVAMEMNSVEVLKRLVELSFGLSIVPAMSVVRERAAHTLTVARVAGLPAREVGLLTSARGPVARAAEAFAKIAHDLLRPKAKPPN